jgi:transcriptional regulator with XRE-family HTH domain
VIANRLAEIGERLRAYRIGRGLAAEQVAERLGVSRAAVYRIETGEVVKIETLDALARVLETSVCSVSASSTTPAPSAILSGCGRSRRGPSRSSPSFRPSPIF